MKVVPSSAISLPRLEATSIVSFLPPIEIVSWPLLPFVGCARAIFAPLLPPLLTWLICSGDLAKTKIDSSISLSPALVLVLGCLGLFASFDVEALCVIEAGLCPNASRLLCCRVVFSLLSLHSGGI